MKKLLVVIFILFAVNSYSQKIKEKKIVNFPVDTIESDYNFSYDPENGTYVKMVYNQEADKYSLESNKGKSSDYNYFEFFSLVFDKFGNYYVVAQKNPEPDDRYEKRFVNLMSNLFGLIYDYMANIPLIFCWLAGKDIAQKRMDENQENEKFLEETHVHFCKKYSCPVKIEDQDRFVIDLNEYLKSLSLEQLELLQMEGFPIEMPKKLSRKTNRILGSFLDRANQQMEMMNGK